MDCKILKDFEKSVRCNKMLPNFWNLIYNGIKLLRSYENATKSLKFTTNVMKTYEITKTAIKFTKSCQTLQICKTFQ